MIASRAIIPSTTAIEGSPQRVVCTVVQVPQMEGRGITPCVLRCPRKMALMITSRVIIFHTARTEFFPRRGRGAGEAASVPGAVVAFMITSRAIMSLGRLFSDRFKLPAPEYTKMTAFG